MAMDGDETANENENDHNEISKISMKSEWQGMGSIMNGMVNVGQ